MGTGNPHEDTLRRIKRGLSGYISYLAACEMNSAFSEYVLYEPMLRILTARGYEVECEYAMPNNEQGDDPRIDFVGNHHDNGRIAIEVKWKKHINPQIQNDFQKLSNYHHQNGDASCFLCVFGRRSHIEGWVPNVNQFVEFGDPVYADFGQTRFGCRIFELAPN